MIKNSKPYLIHSIGFKRQAMIKLTGTLENINLKVIPLKIVDKIVHTSKQKNFIQEFYNK